MTGEFYGCFVNVISGQNFDSLLSGPAGLRPHGEPISYSLGLIFGCFTTKSSPELVPLFPFLGSPLFSTSQAKNTFCCQGPIFPAKKSEVSRARWVVWDLNRFASGGFGLEHLQTGKKIHELKLTRIETTEPSLRVLFSSAFLGLAVFWGAEARKSREHGVGGGSL